MSKKAGIVIGVVLAAVVAVAVGCVVLMGGKEEAYRSIMVYQVNGSATITRERVGDMAAYENLMLQSGDSVSVGLESSMRLKLDDDKYLLAEQDTRMDIVAEGDGADSKTSIDLKQGSVTSEIQNKLGPNASYEVNTPNSIMAVRGTIFRVEVKPDANGDMETKLTVLKGTVSSRAVLPDGTVLDEEVLVEAGEELIIDETSIASAQLNAVTEIDYESLPQIVQDYIEEIGMETPNDTPNADAQAKQPDAQQQAAANEEENAEQPQLDADAKTPEDAEESKETPQSKEQPKTPQQPKSTEQPRQQESAAEEQGVAKQPQESAPQEQGSQPQEPQSKPQNPTPSTGNSSQGSSGGGSKGKTKTQYYTVTFQYNGVTFGTQKVKKGDKATEPKFSPTENGAWDYDFSTKVNKSLTVQWIEK